MTLYGLGAVSGTVASVALWAVAVVGGAVVWCGVEVCSAWCSTEEYTKDD
jgi:hypothetical protein